MKKCTRCKQSKPTEDFKKNKAKKDGLSSECKLCAAEQDHALRQKRLEERKDIAPAPVGNKKCSRCRIDKPLKDFTRDNSRSDGFGHRCKDCQRQYHSEWRAKSDTYKIYQTSYYEENKEAINARNSAYYERNKEWLLPLMNDRRFLKKYGMNREQALGILEVQGGCAICKIENPGSRGWCVDHDHETNKVRGILCGKCNTGIAFLGDTEEGVSSALDYLKK